MTNKIIYSMIILILLILNSCAKSTVVPVIDPQEPSKVVVVSETSKIKVIEIIEDDEKPAKKNKGQVIEEEEISSEVKDLLSIADKQVESLSYKYKGPDTKDLFFEVYVKGDKVKYTIDPTFKDLHLDDDAYDTIYINNEFKTALAYCDGRTCRVKGKKEVLDYSEYYLLTPFDWLSNIENAEKIGEKSIDRRNTWKISTIKFTVWIDTFFGVPMQVEFAGNTYQFKMMNFNKVKDDDVSPKG